MIIPFINRFLHWLIIGIISPVLSLLILSKGVSIELLGVVLGITSFIIIVFEVPSGFLSDYAGRKKIYQISIGIFIIGFTIEYFAHGLLFVTIGFALYGISRALSSGSVESIFINEFRRKNDDTRLHRLMTTMSAGETIGLAIGAATGGFIPDLWRRKFPDMNYYNGNILLCIAILIILFIISSLTINEEIPYDKNPIKKYISETFKGLNSSSILKLLLVGVFVWGVSINAIELYWQPFLKALGTEGEIKTWIFGITNSGYFISSLMGTLLITFLINKSKISQINILLIMRICMGITIIILAVQQAVAGFITGFWFLFLLNGASNIPENTLYNINSTDKNRSSLLSIASLSMQSGVVVGAFMYSILIWYFEIKFIWIISGFFMIGSLIPYLLLKKHIKDHS